MLLIRKEQMAILAEDLERRAVAAMLRHAAQFFPVESASLGHEMVEDLAGRSRRRGRLMKWSEPSVYKYFNLCVLRGRDVGGEDWIAQTLSDPNISDPDECARLVYQEAIARLRRNRLNHLARQRFFHGE